MTKDSTMSTENKNEPDSPGSEHNRQHYRKGLSTKGLIFLSGTELEMIVRNISITGFLGEIEPSDKIKDIKSVFQVIQESTIVDVYLNDLRIAGEAEIVRVDMADGHVFIALEFKNIAYDVDNPLYKRKVYRKSMAAPGQIKLYGHTHSFVSRNVSVEGLMIHIPEHLIIQEGEVVRFVFERLELVNEEAKVVWVEYDGTGGTMLGLQFSSISHDIKGIPKFAH